MVIEDFQLLPLLAQVDPIDETQVVIAQVVTTGETGGYSTGGHYR